MTAFLTGKSSFCHTYSSEMATKHFVCNDDNGKIFAETKVFDDKLYVDVRRYFKPEDSQEFIPTRRGVCFRMEQWQEFLSNLGNISEALDKEQPFNLKIKDSKIEVTLRQRRFMSWGVQYIEIKCDRREQPTHPKKMLGVSFSTKDYKAFLDLIPILNKEIGL